jgi:hypothetical protein
MTTDASALPLDLPDEAVWDLETRFWQGDAAFFDAWLAPQALMVFPDPIGILNRAEVLDSIRGTPRWTDVRFTKGRLERPTAGVVVVAYRVAARRDGDDAAHAAWASSTYTRSDGVWSLVLHQQTPIT